MDDFLFKSPLEAITFATNFNHAITPRSATSQLAAPNISKVGSKGLGGLDGAGQAGLILSELRYLPMPLGRPVLICRTAPRSVPCSCGRECCSGKTRNWEWYEAFSSILSQLKDLEHEHCRKSSSSRGIEENPQLRSELVKKYFGSQLTLKDIATKVEVSPNTAGARLRFIYDTLKASEDTALQYLDARFVDLGWIAPAKGD